MTVDDDGRNEAGRFVVGGDSTAGRTRPQWVYVFNRMFEFAIGKYEEQLGCPLSIQDVFLMFGVPKSTYYTKAQKIEECHQLDKDIQAAIIARVNRGGLLNDYNATTAIWRMKQLGEIDSRDVNQNHSGSIDGAREHRVIFENYKKNETSKE
jgi:hypothetical protein